jgi:aarF domain-containing kinase
MDFVGDGHLFSRQEIRYTEQTLDSKTSSIKHKVLYCNLAEPLIMFRRLRLSQVSRLSSTFRRGFSNNRAKTTTAPSSKGKKALYFLGGLAGLGVAGSLFMPEGGKRSAKFWYKIAPVYAHYRFTQWKVEHLSQEEQDVAYNELHDLYAAYCEEVTLEMRGFYLKNAQLMGTRDDYVPPQYLEWCKRMQDEVPTPFEPGLARQILEEALGQRVEDVFLSFEDHPRQSASIGQVHKAQLLNGEWVAVKIQYPGIEQKFRADLETIISFCTLAMPQHVSPLQEIEKQFLTEFNYKLEAENLVEVYENIMPLWGKQVTVPRPRLDLCRENILVMEWLDGVRLIDGVRAQYERVAKSQGVSLAELEAKQKRDIKSGVSKHRSLYEDAWGHRMISTAIKLVDFGRNIPRFLYNLTLGWLPFLNWATYYHTEIPLNLGKTLDLLIRVHAHEIMVDGVFNGDPHPGNVLLLKDGRLGLIDYGQVKKLTDAQRLSYARLIDALARDDKKEIVRVMKEEGGLQTQKDDFDTQYQLTAFYFDRDTDDVTEGLGLQAFMDEMELRDPLIQGATDFVMASRVSLMMRGMGLAFGIQLETAPVMHGIALDVLAAAGLKPNISPD